MIPFQKDLALALILRDFGEVVHDVCKALFQVPSSLKTLESYLPYSLRQIQSAILVLLQHSCIQSYPHLKNAYVADETVILQRVHVPRICLWIKTNIGDIAESLFYHIHLHGRVRLSKLIPSLFLPEDKTVRDVIAAMRQLLSHKFIYRTGLSHDSSLVYDLTPGISAFGKPGSDNTEDEGVYWAIDVAPFIEIYRHELLCKQMAIRFGHEAASIIKVLYSIGNQHGCSVQEIKNEMDDQCQMSFSELQEFLQILVEEAYGILVQNGHAYALSPSASQKFIESLLIEKVIAGRYSDKHLRLYRILAAKGVLEQDKICGMAMVANFKATRAMLNEMLRDEILHCQEVAKSADRAPGRCIYLWTINHERTLHKVLSLCYQAQYNILVRLHHEGKKNVRILSKVELLHHHDQMDTNEETDELQNLQSKLDKLRSIQLNVADDLTLLCKI